MPDPAALLPSAVTPQDVRMFLIDRNPGDNTLLDAPEFAPDQVASALRLCVDKYNSAPPLIGDSLEAATFPHRYELIVGAASILLNMMALNLTRNRLNYQTREGTAVDDKARAEVYFKMAQEMGAEFDARVKAIKVSRNLANAYGGVGSQFDAGSYW